MSNNSRICKKCKVNKSYLYLTQKPNGRSCYKSEDGLIWKGAVCGLCYKQHIRSVSNKQPLKSFTCLSCGVLAMEKASGQLLCSKGCREAFKASNKILSKDVSK